MTTSHPSNSLQGRAGGVPFVALPPRTRVADQPVVLAWHLMDPPRTETAFASALPLAEVDAWRIYLALPMSPHRLPPGGEDAVMAAGREDAVRKLKVPIVEGAVAELPQVLADLSAQLEVSLHKAVLIGGSDGSAVAAQVALAATDLDLEVGGLALLSPVAQMRAIVDTVAAMFGFEYPWDDETLAIAARQDLVARAREVAVASPSTLLVVGSEDDADGVVAPARALAEAVVAAGGTARLEMVDGMAHALAKEPGIAPEPQTSHAAQVDALVSEWIIGLGL